MSFKFKVARIIATCFSLNLFLVLLAGCGVLYFTGLVPEKLQWPALICASWLMLSGFLPWLYIETLYENWLEQYRALEQLFLQLEATRRSQCNKQCKEAGQLLEITETDCHATTK